MNRLRIKRLSKTYEWNGSKVNALKKVNIYADDNQIVAVVGPSGCGKTTLLNIIAGFIEPTKGEVVLQDEKPGYVFQDHNLFSWLTVNKNIEFGLSIQKVDKNEKAEIVKKYVDLVGLSGFEEFYPNNLSTGMQQRVAIARTLATNPSVLLMDEPFASLDAHKRHLMQESLLKIQEETEKTIVFVTHDIEEALFLANKIYVLSKRPGTVKAVINNPLPKKRNHDIKFSKKFVELRKEISNLIRDEINEYSY